LNKNEAKELLSIIQPNIKKLEEENLPVLEGKIKSVIKNKQEIFFEEWESQLPFGLLDLLERYNGVLKKKSVKEEWFYPSIFHEKDELLGNLFLSFESSLKELKQYKSDNLHKLKVLEEKLSFIVENDAMFLFMLFKNKDIKTKLSEAKYLVETNKSLLDDFLFKMGYLDKESSSVTNPWKDLVIDPKRLFSFFEEDIKNHSVESDVLKEFHHKVKEKQEILELDSKRYVEKQIIEDWEELFNQQFEKDLSMLSFSTIEDYYQKEQKVVPISIQNGYKSILTMIKYGEDLKDKYALTEDEYSFLSAVLNDVADKVKQSTRPKIRANHLSFEQRKLVTELFVYKNYSKQREEAEKELFEQFTKWFEEYNKLMILAENRYIADTLLDEKAFSIWCELEKWLYEEILEIDLNFNELLTYTTLKYDEILFDVAEREFKEESATYYALLEKITGKGLDNSTSDLPKFIIEKVNQVQINENQLKVTMRPYQEFGAKFLLYQKNILLGDEMGLGKTIQALAVANHLFQEHQRKCMILLPLSVLENWNKEILKWTELPVYRFSASNKNKINDFIKWKQEGGILLANYEQAKYLIQGVDGVQIDLLILDEAHYIKNADAMRTKNSIALAQRANYKLFMTGTPLENNVREMQHLVSVLNPDLPESVFRERPDEEDFKKDLANVYLRRKREEVLDELPEMEVINLWSEFSDKQIELYETEAFSQECSVMKLRRMAFLGEDSEKIKQIIDICKEARENGMKVLVFSYFKTDVLYKLRDLLTHTASDILSGDISPARRQEVIDEFSKDSNQTVLLAQIEAGGVGLNIQSANIVILCEPQWKPSTEQQAISRVYRMGQTRDVLVYRLLTKDSIDEPIMALIHKKEVEFDKYAKDSLVADAFVASEKMTEKEVQSKIIEIERNRISARKKNIA
jgi:SNF2 family DNA/RNA helicase